MGPLNQKLDELRAEKEAARDPAATALMHRATDELRDSGILDAVASVGDAAPSWARPELDGLTLRSRALLERGPLVLSFFRGRW